MLVLGLTGLKAQDCRNMMLTTRIVSEKENMQMVVRHEFGHDADVADWSDLKQIRNVEGWASCMNLHNGQTFMVTCDGKYLSDGMKQYFVRYASNGKLPFGFLVLDKIGNKLFLGSWYGDRRNILAYKNDGHRNDARRDEPVRNEPIRNDVRRNDEVNYGSLKLTYKNYSEKQNLRDEIRREFNGKCEMADWLDLKAMPNIDEFISRLRLQRDQTFFVTKNGELTLGRDRQYFVLYSPSGRLPVGFAAHDQIRNKLFLGSWYNERRQILVRDFRNH